jgi:hypothetical protein
MQKLSSTIRKAIRDNQAPDTSDTRIESDEKRTPPGVEYRRVSTKSYYNDWFEVLPLGDGKRNWL